MKTYRAMYRCRLCGKAFYYGESGKNQAMFHLLEIVMQGKPTRKHEPQLLEIHECGKPFESMGLADFIGWDAEEEDTTTNRKE